MWDQKACQHCCMLFKWLWSCGDTLTMWINIINAKYEWKIEEKEGLQPHG